jgi:GGDEF domain-containing protein/CHASE3 domain sensor protein
MKSSSKTKGADLKSGQMHRLGIKKSIAGFFRTSLTYFFSLNIANKLMLGFIPLVVILVLISSSALINLNRLNNISNSILNTDVVVIAASEKMIDAIWSQELYARRYLILKTKDLLELFWEKDKVFKQHVSKIKAVPEDRNFPIDKIDSLHNEYNDILIQGLANLDNPSSLRVKKIEKKIKKKQDTIIALIKGMEAEAIRDQNEKTGKTSAIGTTAFRASVILCVFGILLSVTAALLITRNISGAIRKLKIATQMISNGEFEFMPEIRNKDELGDLSEAFITMAKRLKQLEEMSLDTSPLTRLPGGVSIEKTMQERILSGDLIAFCLFDIDNFKSYNDHYGYAKGNDLIKATAKIILDAVSELGTADDYIGHIGGDDFVIITKPDSYEKICNAVIDSFDKTVPVFYDSEIRKRGYIIADDRQGKQVTFPLASISIAVVTNAKRKFINYIQFGEIAAEMKEYAKSFSGSVCKVDNRTN